MSDCVNVTTIVPAQQEQTGKCLALITPDRPVECVSVKSKGSERGTETQTDEHTHTQTLHRKQMDNAPSVVWGNMWQTLNNFNEPYLL